MEDGISVVFGPDSDPSSDSWTATVKNVSGWTTEATLKFGYEVSYDGGKTWSDFIPTNPIWEGGPGTNSGNFAGWDAEVFDANSLGHGFEMHRFYRLNVQRTELYPPNGHTNQNFDDWSVGHNFP